MHQEPIVLPNCHFFAYGVLGYAVRGIYTSPYCLCSFQFPQTSVLINMSKLPPGVYRIIVGLGRGVEPQALTRWDENVTILPPSKVPTPEQEVPAFLAVAYQPFQWRVVPGKDGNVIIERPSPIIPSIYDAPGKPEEGAQVVPRLSEFPPNEWHLAMRLDSLICEFELTIPSFSST